MAYKVIILYRLYMPSYVLGTFTEYPYRYNFQYQSSINSSSSFVKNIMNFLKNLYESKEALYKFSKNIRFFSGNVLIHQNYL